MNNENSAQEIFTAKDCLKKGHTTFLNGQHGDGWLDISSLLRFPINLTQIVKLQAELIKRDLPQVTLIVSPAISGSIIGSHVAKEMGCEFAVNHGKGDDIIWHRRYNPATNQPVCIVEDIISSGTDFEANIKFLQKCGFTEIYGCCWMNRREDDINGVRVISLFENPFKKYAEEDCPFCKHNDPVIFEGVRE